LHRLGACRRCLQPWPQAWIDAQASTSDSAAAHHYPAATPSIPTSAPFNVAFVRSQFPTVVDTHLPNTTAASSPQPPWMCGWNQRIQGRLQSRAQGSGRGCLQLQPWGQHLIGREVGPPTPMEKGETVDRMENWMRIEEACSRWFVTCGDEKKLPRSRWLLSSILMLNF
jgi:hypothetical protein